MEIDIADHGAFLAKYEPLGEVGIGGQGRVYRARDRRTDDILAAKVLHLSAKEDFDTLHELRKEARTLQSLDHPSILQYHGSSLEKTALGSLDHYIITEFIEGKSLSEEIETRQFSEEEIREVATHLYEALCAAHTKGIIHRDVKPSNVMLETSGRVVLTDFGVAKLIGTETSTASVGAGTVYYMAPEQWSKESIVSPESDFYSLALVLQDMAKGKMREDIVDFDKPEDSITCLTHLSDGFRHYLGLMLSRDPTTRREGIEGIVGGLDVPATDRSISQDVVDSEKAIVHPEISFADYFTSGISTLAGKIGSLLSGTGVGVGIAYLGVPLGWASLAGAVVTGGVLGLQIIMADKSDEGSLPELEEKPKKIEKRRVMGESVKVRSEQKRLEDKVRLSYGGHAR